MSSLQHLIYVSIVVSLAVAPSLSYSQDFDDDEDYLAEREIKSVMSRQNVQQTAGTVDYTCPMHPEVHKKAPGQCPICSMALVDSKTQKPTETKATTRTSKFAFGLFMGQSFSLMTSNDASYTPYDGYRNPTNMPQTPHTMPPNSSDMPGMQMAREMANMPGMTNQQDTNQSSPSQAMATMLTMTAKGGYGLSEITSFTVGVPFDFKDGIGDPAAGINFHVPLGLGFTGLLSAEITAPLSRSSQTNSKITSLLFSVGPMYMDEGLSIGLMGTASYSFYRQDDYGFYTNTLSRTYSMSSMSGDMSGMNMNSIELMRHGGMVSLGYPIYKNLRGLLSAELSASYHDDDSLMWMSDVTLMKLLYTDGGFVGSLGFSLMSDMSNMNSGITSPNQPFIGFRIEYVLGDRKILGGSESCAGMR